MVAGVGELVLDVIIRDGKAMGAVPGGSVFNAMVSLGRTLPGTEVNMISQTGDDKVADIMHSFMSANNVSGRYVERIPSRQSTVSLAILDSRSDASYEFFRDRDMPSPSVPSVSFSEGDALLFGSFYAIDGNTRPSALSVVSSARDGGAMVYYDINFRKSHRPDSEAVLGNCSMSDIVRASTEDLQNLFGSLDPAPVLACRPKLFICTSGPESTTVFLPDGSDVTVPVPSIETVSTVGAGDNFNAGFIRHLLKAGITRTGLSSLSRDVVADAVRTAHSFSADVCRSVENYVSEQFAAALE